MTPLCVDRRAAAAALGISTWVLDRYIADGSLPAVKLPSTKDSRAMSRRVLIAMTDLEAFVARCREVKTRREEER